MLMLLVGQFCPKIDPLPACLGIASSEKKSLSSYQFSRDLAQFEVSETALSNASPLAIRFRLGQITEVWRLLRKPRREILDFAVNLARGEDDSARDDSG
jgi:hypothetical protein